MYYIIENDYLGTDLVTIEITDEPVPNVVSNNIGHVCREEYRSLNEARAAIRDLYLHTRFQDVNGYPFESVDPHVIEVRKLGKFQPYGDDATREYVYDELMPFVESGATESQLNNFIDECERESNKLGYTLDKQIIIDLYNDLRNERESNL